MARLIDAERFGVISLQGVNEDFVEGVQYILAKIDEAPTVKAYTQEQVQDLIALNKKLSEERLHGEWVYKDGKYRCSVCLEPCATFCMNEPRDNFCLYCGSDNRKRGETK